MVLLMAEIPNNHLGCNSKTAVNKWDKLPVPQLVFTPDFWLPSTVRENIKVSRFRFLSQSRPKHADRFVGVSAFGATVGVIFANWAIRKLRPMKKNMQSQTKRNHSESYAPEN